MVTPQHRVPERPQPGVTACGVCGAINAESRRACARCQTPLGAPPLAPPPPSDDFGPAVRAVAPPARSPGWLLVVVGVSAAVLLGVMASLLSARGLGPFRGPPPAPVETGGVAVETLESSSALGGHAVERIADGDPTTAWAEGAAGSGVGEWVELRLVGEARLRRLVVWNGDQRGDRFGARNRVRGLRIEVGGERFAVELVDTRGRQVVELPRPVVSDRLRLTVTGVYPGTLRGETALSEVQVYASPLT